MAECTSCVSDSEIVQALLERLAELDDVVLTRGVTLIVLDSVASLARKVL